MYTKSMEKKHYRYRKVTPEILEKMKDLRGKDLTYKDIAKKLKLNPSIVGYWLNPETREKAINKGKEFYSKLSKKKKKEIEKEHYDYKKEYNTKRYSEDEEFRKRMIGYVQTSFKRKREEWIKKGLCSRCGRKRKDKRWRSCEKCRKKVRKNGIK